MSKILLSLVGVLFCSGLFSQVAIKVEPVKYNYSRGAGHYYWTLNDNLCYFETCKAQIIRVGDVVDTAQFRQTNYDPNGWKDFYFKEISKVDSSKIPWRYDYITVALTWVDSHHFFGRYLLGYGDGIYEVTKGSIRSMNLSGGITFGDNGEGVFYGNGCTGTIIYDDNGYLTVSITTTESVQQTVFRFQYQVKSYRKDKGVVEFDVPYGYWAWFLRGSAPSLSGTPMEAKFEIINTGKENVTLNTDQGGYSYGNGTLKAGF